MLSIYPQVVNPITKAKKEFVLQNIGIKFGTDFVENSEHCYSLRQFSEQEPSKYFDLEIFQYAEKLFTQKIFEEYRDVIKENIYEIDKAIIFLKEINAREIHDEDVSKLNDLNEIRYIDREIHPLYLRLIEGVLKPFLLPIAIVSRKERGKGTDGLEIFSICKELKDSDSECFIKYYENTVRNGIAHGGLKFEAKNIVYTDKKGNSKTLQTKEMIHYFDGLIDTCNALYAAYSIQFLNQIKIDRIQIPGSILENELSEEVNNPWWKLIGCLESEVNGKPQLNIIVKTSSRQKRKIDFSTIQTGILAEYFSQGYDRYFVHIESDLECSGWGAFNGAILKKNRINKETELAAYQDVIEDKMVMVFGTREFPKFISAISSIFFALKILTPIQIALYKQKRGIPKMEIKQAECHRKKWGCVIKGAIFVESTKDQNLREIVKNNCIRWIRAVKSSARKNGAMINSGYLPIGFAQISVFCENGRSREIVNSGLTSKLVCTIRLHRNKQIQSPDIAGSEIELVNGYRIAWNKRWIESTLA